MKANELMINDWVEWMGNYCKVDLPLLMTEYQDNIDSNYVKPIPLTEEILEKNGFKLKKCKTEMQSDNSIITFYGNHLDIIVTKETEQIRISKNIKYIHELQHALRLCWLHELADNFKVE